MHTMWWLMLIPAAVLVSGFAVLLYACGKQKEEDLWDPEILRQHGYGDMEGAVEEGRQFVLNHPSEEAEVFAYDGVRLHGLLIPAERAKGTIVLMHGWRSGWKLDFSCALRLYHEMGLNLLLTDQRAHGASGGLFTTFGVKESRDVCSWVTYASQLFGVDHPIFLGGISMGASSVLMAADASFEKNVRGIIADCGFTSPYEIIRHVIRQMGRWIPAKAILALLNLFTALFVGFRLREKDTRASLQGTTVPVLLIHGLADTFVPSEMSRQAYEACASQKRLILVEGARHGMSFPTEPERVRAEVREFVKENLR